MHIQVHGFLQSDLSWLALCNMMHRPSSFPHLMSTLDLLLKPQLAYRMASAISKHAHRPSPWFNVQAQGQVGEVASLPGVEKEGEKERLVHTVCAYA